jgi:hypothetical protein
MPRKKAESAILPVVVVPAAHWACGLCRYRVEHLPRTPNGTTILQCRRFPQAVEIYDTYWCGEWEKADAGPGNAGN